MAFVYDLIGVSLFLPDPKNDPEQTGQTPGAFYHDHLHPVSLPLIVMPDGCRRMEPGRRDYPILSRWREKGAAFGAVGLIFYLFEVLDMGERKTGQV